MRRNIVYTLYRFHVNSVCLGNWYVMESIGKDIIDYKEE